MRRIMMALLAGALLSAGATWALAAHVGEALPSECADSHGGTDIADTTKTTYVADPANPLSTSAGQLTVDLDLEGSSCLAADYSVVVFDEPYAFGGGTSPAILDAVTFPGDGESTGFTIQRRIADDDSRICVNIAVSTTQHVDTATNTSTAPSGGGNAPSMQDSDSNSVDTETIVDWGPYDLTTGDSIPCVKVDLGGIGAGGQGYG